jgi:parallel beta-helix repeat protein
VLRFHEATARLIDCAVLASPGDGIQIVEGSNVEIDSSLVAAAWGTGITVAEGTERLSRVRLRECDIRNCHYAGVRIGRGSNDVIIERCRISGAAWHGVRYDNASPDILNNIIFGNARCGIYASGLTKATVANNLFYANDMAGFSGWFRNADRVFGNTFVENEQVGLAILGASEPTVQQNIFYANGVAVSGGSINDDSRYAESGGPVLPQSCLFWHNDHNLQWRIDPNTTETITLDERTDTRITDPQFISVADQDFSLDTLSPAREAHIGVVEPIPFASPWPLQPEEVAIIPEGDTRDYRQWKKP